MTADQLAQEIIKHKNLYYSGKPEIDDYTFDKLEEKLKKLDPNHPVLKMVGSEVRSNNKIQHETKMLSLDKTYREEDLISWLEKGEAISTHKIDGSSCSLIYEDGYLKLGKTRGNGSFGEDITQKVWFLNSVPKKIMNKKTIEVRGEIFCTEKNFIQLAHEMEERSLDKPTSQRNIVAGLLGRKENIDLCSYLSFKSFQIICDDRFDLETQKMDYLKKLGFDIPEYEVHQNSSTIKNVLLETKDFIQNGEYLIDGLVFSYNLLSLHEELGYTAHHPRYKLAFKFQGESKVAKIEKIDWGVSRNGILTPVAHIKPTELSGALVSRVTLHNYGLVKEFKLKKGDQIEVVRSGEVIPKFMGVFKSSSEEYIVPKNCPSCGKKVVEVDIRLICQNTKCPDKIKDEILNYISKMDVDDLSDKRLSEMIRAGLVIDIPSLYDLTVENLLTLDKTKEKLANKIYKNIQESLNTTLLKFISSLGISGGAVNKTERIINAGYDTISKFLKINVADLQEIEGFAEKSATDYVESFKEKIPMIKTLQKKGLKLEKPPELEGENLKGLKFCITGSLNKKRTDIQKDIKAHGGEVQGSVTNKTSFLVTNDEVSSSSKFQKALKLKVPIITEDQLYKKISQ